MNLRAVVRSKIAFVALMMCCSCGSSAPISVDPPGTPTTKGIPARRYTKGAWQDLGTQPTRRLEDLVGLPSTEPGRDEWGGRADAHGTKTGFFHVERIGKRWWAIDPDGNEYINVGLNSLYPAGGLGSNATKAEWASQARNLLDANGFDGTGAFSDDASMQNATSSSRSRLAYSPLLNLMAGYAKQRGGKLSAAGAVDYPNKCIFVFDPEFEEYVNAQAKTLSAKANDPALFGYFSDNELPFGRLNLDGYLQLPSAEPGYQAAQAWMKQHKASKPTTELREAFLAFEVDRYYSIVSKAIKKYDPNHMYIGTRITNAALTYPEIFKALAPYLDVVSVNYYQAWTPDPALMASWTRNSGRPIIVSEFYTKGDDSGLADTRGAGWAVPTQDDRGSFYQNFTLSLIQSGSVIGWHWFKYEDSVVNNTTGEDPAQASNMGVVSKNLTSYAPLLDRMRPLNARRYALADFFDRQ